MMTSKGLVMTMEYVYNLINLVMVMVEAGL